MTKKFNDMNNVELIEIIKVRDNTIMYQANLIKQQNIEIESLELEIKQIEESYNDLVNENAHQT